VSAKLAVENCHGGANVVYGQPLRETRAGKSEGRMRDLQRRPQVSAPALVFRFKPDERFAIKHIVKCGGYSGIKLRASMWSVSSKMSTGRKLRGQHRQRPC
jgi:hypothetical protein